jgi:hypothetical protein
MAIQVGRRIIFDKTTGEVIMDMGEMQGDVIERQHYDGISHVDLPYGYESDKFSRVKKWHIDVNTGLPVFDELAEPVLTPQEQIAELQQQLLQVQGVV